MNKCLYNQNENAGAAVATATHGVRRSSKASDTQSLDKNRLQFLGVICVSVAILTGCSVTRGTRHPDGSLTVVNYRLLWSSEAVDFSVTQPSTLNSQPSFNARLKIGKSATDDEAVAAVVAGVVKGITRP
jgi:hypothetical protein